MQFNHPAFSNEKSFRDPHRCHQPPSPGSSSDLSPSSPCQVCKDRRCQNASLFELEKCVSRCHGHGVSDCLGPAQDSWDEVQVFEPNQMSPTGMSPVTQWISAFQTCPMRQLQVGLNWDLCSPVSK